MIICLQVLVGITEELSPGQNATLKLIQVWKGWNFGIYFLCQIPSVWFNLSVNRTL